ncbi:MAG: 30S ribosomal protein THX, partial [Flavobacteriales bacterium]|nr:30S ribosomal protein THX [Flavobacteriales bacterium]
MGKGDRKSTKGKRFKGSYGKTRPRKKPVVIAPPKKKAAAKKAAAKPATAKKAAP